MIRLKTVAMTMGVVVLAGHCADGAVDPPLAANIAFFESRIRPMLIAHCYSCHGGDAQPLRGGLRLDYREGLLRGGASGRPAVVPGKPEESPLIAAVRHADDESAMPPDRPKLPDRVIADLETWIRMGAPDPRSSSSTSGAPSDPSGDWEATYRKRAEWWSLQPLNKSAPPSVRSGDWVINEVDRFILAPLKAKGLSPNPPASRRALARRLSFALTGLPPSPEAIARFETDAGPDAYDRFVQSLLDSPHFGERWARLWMDLVHYADTHGYEWDAPAKNAWMYRDYLIRAFNADVPVDRLIREQIAGDLIEPRIDPETGIVESLIGPMSMRLGERRHGDNAAAEGVTQEAISNIVDTISKAYLATTVACAQCHDHKLDAIAQSDYYAMAGVFMSTRWPVRTVDSVDPNESVLVQLRELKDRIRAELGRIWLSEVSRIPERLRISAARPAMDPQTAKKAPATNSQEAVSETLTGWWIRQTTKPITPDEFGRERQRRIDHNREHVRLLADFSRDDPAAWGGWRWDGFGMKHGLTRDGELVVAGDGDAAVQHLLPAGRWSHVWSKRLAGALRSPLLEHVPHWGMSMELAAGNHAAQSVIVDHAFHSERMAFLNRPMPGWLTLTVGNFDTLAGGIDRAPRRVYLELVTKSLNNYFPPRTAYGGLKESDAVDPRSWFGVGRVFRHPPGKSPVDDLQRFDPLFAESAADLPQRFVNLIAASLERWSGRRPTAADVRILNDAVASGLLTNRRDASPALAQLIDRYRTVEKALQPDRTVGSVEDWNEGRNERIGVRGSYTEFGPETERGAIRFLGGPARRGRIASCGRLELADKFVAADNPLTARVFVNRVWLALFGEGLVRTPDDFGHLGQKPTHPELLDHLAGRLIEDGWSLKRMIKLLVCSATWRQSSRAHPSAIESDPENRFWARMNVRRLDAESIRDAMLAVSGSLDQRLFGPPIDPFRTAEDASKRLFSGPLDGGGRRSIYLKMTLMEPPKFLALFNQPIPKLTVGQRDVTNVPNQALALLNDPFTACMAKKWSERICLDSTLSPEGRLRAMFEAALGRPPQPREIDSLLSFVAELARLHGVDPRKPGDERAALTDAAHAIFNLKEFIYVP